MATNRREVGECHRERLAGPGLAVAQALHRGGSRGIDQELESTSPSTATIAPSRRRSAAWRSASSRRATVAPWGSSSRRVGPHRVQAIGWACQRRSPGSSSSMAQPSQRGNPAIEVRARIHGRLRTRVKRGPHVVQLANGWRWRRSSGSSTSARHASHIARSGGMLRLSAAPSVLGSNREPPIGRVLPAPPPPTRPTRSGPRREPRCAGDGRTRRRGRPHSS